MTILASGGEILRTRGTGEQYRQKQDWMAMEIRPRESLFGRRLWAGNSPNPLGSDIKSLPHGIEKLKAPALAGVT